MPTPSSVLGLLAGSRVGYGDGYSRFSSTILPVNAADFGVHPDNVDNAVGINDAIVVAMRASSGRFARVFLPPGQIRFGANGIGIRVPDQAGALAICGAGAGRSFSGGVNGDPTDIFGTELVYEGQSGSAFLAALTGANARLYLRLEDFNLFGNRDVAGATGGSGIHLQVGIGTSAILATFRGVHVLRAFDHGIFFDGNVFECVGTDIRSNQNGGRGINIAGNGPGIPGEIRLFGVTANLNIGRGVHVGGGGHCALYGVTASDNTDSGLVVDGTVTEVFNLQVEGFATPGVLINNTTGSRVVGLLATYTASPRTLLRFGAGAVACLASGVRTNSQAGDTDIDLVAGATRCSIENYFANDFTDRIVDAGEGTLFTRGASRPLGATVWVNSPAALAAGNTNDYAPPQNAVDSETWRMTADAAGSVLTGITGGKQGRRIRIMKVGGAGTLTISNQNVASAAANRFLHPAAASPALATDDIAEVEYDSVTQRWRVVSVLQ